MVEDMQQVEFTQEQKEEFFGEIVRLYDLADDVVNVVGQEKENRIKYMEFIIPLISQFNSTTDTLSSVYTRIVLQGEAITEESKCTMEKALYDTFIAIKQFADKMEICSEQ